MGDDSRLEGHLYSNVTLPNQVVNKFKQLTFDVHKLVEESDGPYLQKLRKVSHPHLK